MMKEQVTWEHFLPHWNNADSIVGNDHEGRWILMVKQQIHGLYKGST